MPYIAGNVVIGQELHDGDFNKGTEITDRYSIKLDPASVTPVSKSADGIKVGFPAVIPTTSTIAGSQITGPLPASSTSNTVVYDAVANTLTSTVNGVASVTPLDPSAGSSLSIVGTNLVLKDDQGVVISSTPIAGLDAQTLLLGGSPAVPTLAISNGNVVNLPSGDPATIAGNFPLAPVGYTPPPGVAILGTDGNAFILTTVSSSFGTPLYRIFPV